MRVQLMVEASGLVDIELTEEQIAALESRADDGDFPISLDDVPGVSLDDVLNQLDFEVSDFNVVRPKKISAVPEEG